MHLGKNLNTAKFENREFTKCHTVPSIPNHTSQLVVVPMTTNSKHIHLCLATWTLAEIPN